MMPNVVKRKRGRPRKNPLPPSPLSQEGAGGLSVEWENIEPVEGEDIDKIVEDIEKKIGSKPSEPVEPQSAQNITEQMHASFGKDIGCALVSVIEAITHDRCTEQERTAVEEAMGRIATRHPNWFGGWMADAMDILIIAGIVFAKLKNKNKKEEIKNTGGEKDGAKPEPPATTN